MDIDYNEILYSLFVDTSNTFRIDCDKYIEYLLNLKKIEIFGFIKSKENDLPTIKTNDIPQFSKFEDVFEVLRITSGSPEKNMNWETLGYYLCPKDASIAARTKYGENHYKLAVQLGLAVPGSNVSLTPLGESINNMADSKNKELVVSNLVLRIPIIQRAILEAENKRFNMMSYLMLFLMKSTAERRRSSIKRLLKVVEDNTENSVFLQILWNIVWSEQDEL